MITLRRTYHETHTSGIITLPDGDEIYTLELPWLHNKVGKSCIPEGRYTVKRDHTGRQQWWKIIKVEGRTHIEIHPATTPNELMGCIAPSMAPTNDGRTHNSREACDVLLSWFGEDSWVLEVTS